MTVEVSGMLGDTEKLNGQLTHYSDGGTIELFGGPGTHCVGNFQYERAGKSRNDGRGMMVCDDRRTGPFTFMLSGMKHGSGSGSLNGQRYRFSF